MANLKRNMIELVKDVKEGEVVTEKYWTPVFIPMSVVYEAMDLSETAESGKVKERDLFDQFMDFIATKVYKDQFTKQELMDGLHAPDAIQTLQDQILFVAQGQQTDETQAFLNNKKRG